MKDGRDPHRHQDPPKMWLTPTVGDRSYRHLDRMLAQTTPLRVLEHVAPLPS